MALKELDAVPELRDNPSLKDFTDLPTFAKAFIETKAHVGNSLRPPGPGASEADKKDFYEKLQKHAPHLVPLVENDKDAENVIWNRLGRPDKPEGYTAEVPQGVTVDLEGLRAAAVEAGWTKAQFQKAAAKAIAYAQKTATDTEADSKALRGEWGAAFDQKLAGAADAAAKAKAPEAVVKAIREGKLPSGQLKIWAGLAEALGTETTVIGKQEGGASGGALTPAEAAAQISEIQRNPLYTDRNGGAGREKLIARMVELQAFVTPPKG
jgi:hypothetical protein